jgi:ribokinase
MITVVGSLNMDLFIETERLPRPGETVPGTNFRTTPGGKGANQAFAIARMGAEVTMLGAVGDDAFGKELLGQLASAGVKTDAVLRRDRIPSGTAMIVVDASGQNQIVVAPGANGTVTPDDVIRQAGLIRKSAALVAQLETPLDAVKAALRLAREAGVPTVLNPAPAIPLPDELLHLCDWIISNETEAAELSSIEVKSRYDAASAARKIRQRSSAKGVAVTLGGLGVWIEHSLFTGHIPAFRVPVLDTVGAGDTFIGAFVTRLAGGAEPREVGIFASAAAAIAVTRRGAQAGIPALGEVEAFFRENISAEASAPGDHPPARC